MEKKGGKCKGKQKRKQYIDVCYFLKPKMAMNKYCNISSSGRNGKKNKQGKMRTAIVKVAFTGHLRSD